LNTEKDDVSTGNLYITTTATTIFSAINTPTKALGTTTAVNLFRVSSPTDNRLTYIGNKTKKFIVVCTMSITAASNNIQYSLYISKNGIVLPESRSTTKIANGADHQAIALSCTLSMAPNDYIEVWVENDSGTTSMTVENLNLGIK